MRVRIPSPLLSYTSRHEVAASGATLGEVLADLDRQFPGFRFRVVDEQQQLRPHMRAFVGQDELRALDTPLAPEQTLHLVQALSGG